MVLFNSYRNYFIFFQCFFMGWKNDFTPLFSDSVKEKGFFYH